MQTRLQVELKKFRALKQHEALLNRYHVSEPCSDFYQLIPNSKSSESIDICFMALTHGNELAGIAVINELAEALASGIVSSPLSIGLALGNIQAALEDRRFLERDLNRSFNLQSQPKLKEEKRAKELEVGLSKCSFLVDFHQTIEASSEAFAIFPYEKSCYKLARSIASELAIVTHWGKSFSKDGACTDEFVNKSGGVGITFELGQKGFSGYQEALGFRLALRALVAAEHKLRTGDWLEPSSPARVYTWAEVIDYPEGSAALDEGWYNFRQVSKGERLGYREDGEIIAQVSGPVLFPKYVKSANDPRPKEICRILKAVEEHELGT